MHIVHLLLVVTHSIDNHDIDYLGMVVQLYVQAHLSHYHIFLTQEELIQPKTGDTAEILFWLTD